MVGSTRTDPFSTSQLNQDKLVGWLLFAPKYLQNHTPLYNRSLNCCVFMDPIVIFSEFPLHEHNVVVAQWLFSQWWFSLHILLFSRSLWMKKCSDQLQTIFSENLTLKYWRPQEGCLSAGGWLRLQLEKYVKA